MHRETKAKAISRSVAERVYRRDGYRCVICGSYQASPCAHYISRAQGGLGIEENIVTLCQSCHHRYDQTAEREILRKMIRSYLSGKYPGWNEAKLLYRKD